MTRRCCSGKPPVTVALWKVWKWSDIQISTCQSNDEWEQPKLTSSFFHYHKNPSQSQQSVFLNLHTLLLVITLTKMCHLVTCVWITRSNLSINSIPMLSMIGLISQSSLAKIHRVNSRMTPLQKFLPSPDDCSQFRENYINLIARVTVEKLPHFNKLSDCVPAHICHEFSRVMKEKSVVVSAWLFLY